MNDEKMCPLCSKAVRSDASVREFCALCGMGIAHPGKAPSLSADDGRPLYFCCDDCLDIYRGKVARLAGGD